MDLLLIPLIFYQNTINLFTTKTEKMKIRNIIQVTLIFLINSQLAMSQNYNKQFIKQIKNAIGKDFKYYTFLSYPVDNFGVLTFYTNSAEDQNMISPTFKTIGKTKPSEVEDWLNLENFVSIGEGPSITLSNKSQKEISLKTLLPKIYQVLQLSAEYNSKKIITTTLNFNAGYKRIMDPDKVLPMALKIPSVNTGFANKELVYVYGDFVIDKMVVKIEIESSAALKIDAELAKLPKNGDVALAEDSTKSNLSLSIKKEGIGSYTITFNKPVVIARLIKTQPSNGGLEGSSSYLTKNIQDPSLIK